MRDAAELVSSGRSKAASFRRKPAQTLKTPYTEILQPYTFFRESRLEPLCRSHGDAPGRAWGARRVTGVGLGEFGVSCQRPRE